MHVPSKAFAEVVEHEAGTPWISAEQLKELIDSGADIAIFDSRSYEEYHDNSIPGAISVPGAELVYRFRRPGAVARHHGRSSIAAAARAASSARSR